MVFRAGIFRFLQGRFSLVFSVAVSSVLFGLVHGHFLSLPGLTMVGVALAIAYHRTRDIRVPIVFHALFNLNSLLLLKLWPEIAI
ncbi:MAG: CPBP family intramembrane metalloprotease [Verrucomicrobia bacterium]|nr:CPBP family intramembrane metalloprotease [Verrucomicrobiota bacterium]